MNSSATVVDTASEPKQKFSGYQIFVIVILSLLLFTVILDFMVLSPLGAILMPELRISADQFGFVVAAYAFSAGASGLLAAGFADRFDRKRLLLFFYIGFIVGTVLCAIANDYYFLLCARIVTGVFGGVIGSVAFAILGDLFSPKQRGTAMGFTQMAFSGAQVLGIPIGLYLANHFDWHAPFWMIVGVSVALTLVVMLWLKPLTGHLLSRMDKNPFHHLMHTAVHPRYWPAFLATTLLATGGFMLMPFGSAFSVNNLHISLVQIPNLFLLTGLISSLFGPISGRLADKFGKYRMFVIGSIITIVMVGIYTSLGITPFWEVVVLNVLLFAGIMSRMVSAQAMIMGLPVMQDRGAFMSINASVQQISGGIAAWIAGKIVVQTATKLEHYDTLGYVVMSVTVISIGMMWFIAKAANEPVDIAPKEAQPAS